MIPRDGEREFVVSPSGEGDSVSPPPPKGGTTNQETFLKAILRSGLLTREQLDAALRGLSQEVRADPRALANHLIRTGRLSSYQASKLLKGAALGLILGPFQVLAPIGKGGMSTVYLARDARSGQLVALKVLPPKKARRQERLLARFRREMEISRRVAHPNLAWTYEVGVEQGVYYIAMEFIPGKSLYRLVAEQGPLEARRAARLFVEVCSALAHAHEQGLIHRDLKPSNIMVTPNDHAKVLDLGLALVQGESSADRQVVGGAGYVVGSMDYIAPEQTTDSSRVDARSDVYGLGCSLYYTLSGRPPFPGGTTLEKIQCHRSEEPTWLGTLNRSVPPELAQLVHRMMAKAPEQRFPSAEAVRQALLAWAPEAALPMDSQGDQAYERAIADLQNVEVSSPEWLIDWLALEAQATPQPVGGPALTEAGDSGNPYLWVGAILAGFWVVLLGVLGIVFLFR